MVGEAEQNLGEAALRRSGQRQKRSNNRRDPIRKWMCFEFVINLKAVLCWDCHFGIHHPISRHSWCKIYSARLARLIFREGFPDSSPTLIGESLRPPEAADPECQLRLNSTLKLIKTMANRHFANNNGNVVHLDPIGSAAYDINIPGSDYDFVLRFKHSAVLEGDSLLLGDWRGDGLGHPGIHYISKYVK